MNRSFRSWRFGLIALAAFVALAEPRTSLGVEETFDLLQIGTQTYTNVTVTSKTKAYIFVLHAGGLTNIKLADLPVDLLVKLGYPDPTAPKVQTNGPVVWAKQTLSKLPVEQIKTVERQVKEKLVVKDLAAKLPFQLPTFTRNLVIAISATILAFFVFHCFCCSLICKKAGTEPGVLIWIPLLQLLPLLKAARMSRWWFLAYFVPVLNVVAQVIWSFKIADARNKSAIIGLFLLLPLLHIFAFLFLAFADRLPDRVKPLAARPVEIMTLEAV